MVERLHLLLLASFSFPLLHSKCIIFNFGDSNSDTGSLTAGLGLYLGPPAGRRFFNRTTGRFCDGRLYIDFICENLKMNFLSPYLESSGSEYSNGVNFAVAGSAILGNFIPFPLSTQVLQFLHFRNRTQELLPQGKGSMISSEQYQKAVYSIDIGQNDISIAFTSNLSHAEFTERIPLLLSSIKASVKGLHKIGATKFWLYNTGPLGCLPQTLALHKTNNSEVDPIGCLAAYNNAAKQFNGGLKALCHQMRTEFHNATIILTDMYRIKYDLFSNHTKYGFESPLMACCGHGGPPFNYRDLMTCGQPTATACDEGSRYVSWDGVHFTEAANEIIASKILSGKYSEPRAKLGELCNHRLVRMVKV